MVAVVPVVALVLVFAVVAVVVGAGVAVAVLAADGLAVLLRERAHALADATDSRGPERVLAVLDLLLYLLTPIAGIEAAGGRHLGRHSRRRHCQRGDCEAREQLRSQRGSRSAEQSLHH